MHRSFEWKLCRRLVSVALVAVLTACGGGNFAQKEDPTAPGAGPIRDRKPTDTIFDDTGLDFGALNSSGTTEPKDALPVNKYLWQASLDTLNFLPLASTDPFTGVIATEWSTTPNSVTERFKVTVYMTSHVLEASSLRVAVFREARNEQGLWVPQQVNPETPLKLENAILTRARQIRIAALDEETTG